MANRIVQLVDQEDNNIYPVPPFGLPLTVESGGTGADNASDAFKNLSGWQLDLDTNNTVDTWVPVFGGTQAGSEGKVQRISLQDYVTAVGTSGIWRYQKWKSGKAECWGTTTFSDTCNNAWGNLYESSSHYYSYPSGLFNSAPSVFITTHGTSASASFTEVSTGGSASRTPNFFVIRPTAVSSAQSWTAHIHAIGTWK